ncbi:MAG: hypothetical protein KY469_22815, partial [Actinobacteria bacterium]|nr:hypothetical protein [Actinomycetota bacterium]
VATVPAVALAFLDPALADAGADLGSRILAGRRLALTLAVCLAALLAAAWALLHLEGRVRWSPRRSARVWRAAAVAAAVAAVLGLLGAAVSDRGLGGTAQALADGAWGVLVAPEHAEAARCGPPGALLAATDPLAALQRLATAWRRALGARVVGITGSTGKTSTKDVLAAMLAPHRAVTATRANYNTEIGLPLTVLEAPPATEVLVLEMAMRGPGQIAELAAIAEPDVGVVVNVGPVHLEQLGSIEAVAAEKAVLLRALPPGGTAVVPAGEALLEKRAAAGVTTVTFGPGGDVAQPPEGLELSSSPAACST